MLFVSGRHPFEAGSFDWATFWFDYCTILYHAPFPLRTFRSAPSTVNPLILAFVSVGPIANTQSEVSWPSEHGRPR